MAKNNIPPNFSIFPHRQRKMSESCLDTTSVGRVRTHSGCNPSISPFHSPFSPPMSPYGTQSQLYTNISQDQDYSNKSTDTSQESPAGQNVPNFYIDDAYGMRVYLGADIYRSANALATETDFFKGKITYFFLNK